MAVTKKLPRQWEKLLLREHLQKVSKKLPLTEADSFITEELRNLLTALVKQV